MGTYDVTITEILKKTVSVEAESEEDAESIVEAQRRNGEHILLCEDFADVEYEASLREPINEISDANLNSGEPAALEPIL